MLFIAYPSLDKTSGGGRPASRRRYSRGQAVGKYADRPSSERRGQDLRELKYGLDAEPQISLEEAAAVLWPGGEVARASRDDGNKVAIVASIWKLPTNLAPILVPILI